MNSSYRVNEPDVTFEVFDAEVMIINLRNGNYYSLRESAVPIWGLLRQGRGIDEIGRALAGSTATDEALTTAAVRHLVEELEREQLLVPSAPTTDGAPGEPAVALPANFTPPVIDRYTDMQQLLLMDPIHEVDATGWPAKAPGKDGN